MAGEAVMTLYGRGRRVQKCLAVHAFAADGSGELRVAPFTKGVTNRTPWFLARSPLGKVRRAPPRLAALSLRGVRGPGGGGSGGGEGPSGRPWIRRPPSPPLLLLSFRVPAATPPPV